MATAQRGARGPPLGRATEKSSVCLAGRRRSSRGPAWAWPNSLNAHPGEDTTPCLKKRGKAVTHSQMATGFNHRWSNHTAHFAKLWRFHHITVATMSKRDSQRYWNQQQRSHNITQLQVGGSEGPILIKEEDGVIRPPTRHR